MRITSKGQVTIPRAIRSQLGLVPETEVEFAIKNNVVEIRKARSPGGSSRGKGIIQRMRGQASVKMSTDEILSLTRGR